MLDKFRATCYTKGHGYQWHDSGTVGEDEIGLVGEGLAQRAQGREPTGVGALCMQGPGTEGCTRGTAIGRYAEGLARSGGARVLATAEAAGADTPGLESATVGAAGTTVVQCAYSSGAGSGVAPGGGQP